MRTSSTHNSSSPPRSLNRDLLVLGLVLLAAAAVRLWGTSYGLPFIYHTDEIFEVKRALKLGAGHFDVERTFKGGLFYILFVEYGIYYLILQITGSIRSSFDFLVRFSADPTPFWQIGRNTVALIGALNVYFVYLLARRIHGRAVGVLAALFLAFASDHTRSSHYITVDVLMVTFVTITLFHVAGIVQTGALRSHLLAGLFAALAVMTKLTAIVVLLPIAIARAYRVKSEGRSFHRLVFDKRVLLGFALFVSVTFVGNPGFFSALRDLLLGRLGAGPVADPDASTVDPFPVRTDNVWLFYIRACATSMGLPVFLLAICGLAFVIIRRLRVDLAMLSFAGVTYVLICSPWQEDQIYPRYALPIQMVLAILAARFLVAAHDRFRGHRWIRPVLALVSILAVLPPLMNSVRQDILMTRADTRSLAKEWIEENIPGGSKIVLEGRGYRASPNTVPLNNLQANVIAAISGYREADRQWLTDEGYGRSKDRFHRAAVEALEGKRTYGLILIGSETSPCRSLDAYLSEGAQYLIIDPEKLGKFLDGANYERFPMVGNLYRDILTDPRLRLVKRFVPESRLGPVLEIYRVEGAS